MTATWSVEIAVEWVTVVLQKGPRGDVSRQPIRHLEGGRVRRRREKGGGGGEVIFYSINIMLQALTFCGSHAYRESQQLCFLS